MSYPPPTGPWPPQWRPTQPPVVYRQPYPPPIPPYPYPGFPPHVSYGSEPARTNHGLHLIVTVCTCGMWAPVWVFIAAVNGFRRRKTTVRHY